MIVSKAEESPALTPADLARLQLAGAFEVPEPAVEPEESDDPALYLTPEDMVEPEYGGPARSRKTIERDAQGRISRIVHEHADGRVVVQEVTRDEHGRIARVDEEEVA